MENLRLNPETPTLSQSGSRRSSVGDPTSPEFEFWMLRNPSFPQTKLLSADQLFVDGVLLPLHLLHRYNSPNPPDPDGPEHPISGPAIFEPEKSGGCKLSQVGTESAPALTPSKRWKDIFKVDKKNASNRREGLEKKKERTRGRSSGSAELNINIWPFSRSRSAGNVPSRPQLYPIGLGARKVNSAPCSRSNSSGESNSRKLPGSPVRHGLYLGRSSPVWQARRGGISGKTSMVPGKKDNSVSVNRRSKTTAIGSSGKAKVMSLNVPIRMGCRHHLSCRSDEDYTGGCRSSERGRSVMGEGGSGGSVATGSNLFNLRSLFSKKVY